MKKYRFYIGVLAMISLVITACTPVQKAPVERRVGDPTERILNTALSCVGHCTGYAESGEDWCFCDANCEQNGNCCADFKTACPDIAG